jgi:hypothetical protein
MRATGAGKLKAVLKNLIICQVEANIMSGQGYKPSALCTAELRKLVLEAIQKTPDYQNPETFHALFGHLERGLTTDDVIHGLESEWVIRRKRSNEREWQWKYEIDTLSIDEEPITIVIAVDSLRREFVVVTRWRDSDES